MYAKVHLKCPRFEFPRKYADRIVRRAYANYRNAVMWKRKNNKITEAEQRALLVNWIFSKVIIDGGPGTNVIGEC